MKYKCKNCKHENTCFKEREKEQSINEYSKNQRTEVKNSRI